MGSEIQKSLRIQRGCQIYFSLCWYFQWQLLVSHSIQETGLTLLTTKNIFDFCFLLQINIKLKSEMPVQIDGEPWMQAAGNVIVRPILTQVLLKGPCYI